MSKRFEEYAPGARAIIVAAERLFGKYGLDGVSLRQIVVAAGQVNPSAVHHHFGSKRGLIQAAYELRTPLIESARQAQLNAMDQENRSSIDDLIAALLEPIIEVLKKQERLLYARFMMRLLPLGDAEHPYFSCLDMCAPSVEIGRRILAHFPKLAPDVVATRVRMAACVFLQGIWDERRVRRLISRPYQSEAVYWDEIFQMALSMLCNPYPPPSRFGAHAPVIPVLAAKRRERKVSARVSRAIRRSRKR